MSGFRNWIWYDDVNLDRCAFSVKNRSATWTLAGRRGENYKVPGRDGSLYNPDKAADENVFTLGMYAAGANLDGTIPADGDRRTKVMEHLDTLTRLFGAPGLHNLLVAETPDYGRKNFLANPSAENAGLKVIIGENVIDNPSGEYSNGDIITRRNFVFNPSMAIAGETRTFRENLARNPRFAGEGSEVIMRRNFALNPTGEVGLRFWRAQLGCRILTARRKRSGKTWPISGIQSIRAVVDGTGDDAVVDLTSIPVDVADTYNFSLHVWNRSELARTYRILVRWFKRDGTFLSADGSTDTIVGIDQVGRLSTGGIVAPAGAATALIRTRLIDPEAGDVFYLDGAMATRGATLRDYFDGDSEEVNGLRHRWADEPGRSVSIQYRVPPRGWVSPDPHELYATTDRARRGSQSARVVLGAAVGANDLVLRQTVAGGAPAQEGDWLSAGVYLQLDEAMEGLTRTAKVSLRCYDSKGSPLGPVLDSGGAAVDDVPLVLDPANWQLVKFVTGQARASTARVVLEIRAGQAWSSGEIFYADCCIIENEKDVGEWFDGNTSDDEVFDYAWEDDPHWSTSTQRGAHVLGYEAGDGGKQYQATSPHLRDYSMLMAVRPDLDPSVRPYVELTPLDALDGEARKHTFSAMVSTQNRTFSMKVGYSTNAGLSWAYGAGVIGPAVDTYYRLNVTVPIVQDTNPDDIRLRVVWDASPEDADIVHIDSLIFEPTESQSRDWFDGDAGKRYSWEARPDRSVSLMKADRANGWSSHGSARPIIRRVASTYSVRGNYAVRSVAAQTGLLGVTTGQDGIDSDNAYSFGIGVRAYATLNVQAGITWFDSEGEIISESFGDITSIGPTTHKRLTVVVDTPPVEAAVAGPFVRTVNEVGPDAWIEVDAGRFGFGVDTSYKDGNSTSWDWTGTPDFSVSQNIAPGVDYWGATNGILFRDGTWSSDRDFAAEYVTTAAQFPTRVFIEPNGKQDKRRFRIKNDEVVYFACDVRAEADCAVQLKFIYGRWSGQGWQRATGETEPGGTIAQLSAGEVRRLTFGFDVSTTNGDATHFRPAVYVYAAGSDGEPTPDELVDGGSPDDGVTGFLDGGTPGGGTGDPDTDGGELGVGEGDGLDGGLPGGPFSDTIDGGAPGGSSTTLLDGGDLGDLDLSDVGIPPVGTAIRIDSAILTRDNANTTYFDGSDDPYHEWMGDPDASTSIVAGPARQVKVERQRTVNFADLGYGTTAEFAVELVAPGTYWEDTIEIRQKMAIPRRGGVLRFDKFEGLTAPINDAIIVITGVIDDFRLEDIGTGEWFEYSEKLTGDQGLVLTCADWDVRTRGGKSRIKYVKASGGILLPVSPPSDDDAPRIRIDADNIGRSATMTIIGRRKYQLA